MALLSVIMSTYNRKEFLPSSIESVLSQTFEDFEFVIVNNGSTDGSKAICQYYAAKDKRIKLIDIEENRGAPIGRNQGLSFATTDYITFVDDDDYCEPEMLELLWSLSQKYNADISLCGSWNNINGILVPYFIFDETLLLDKVRGLHELLLREKYNVAPPTKLFRKSLFDGISYVENVLVDDIHVIYKLFAKANMTAAHGKPLYRFTKHEGNMTNFIQTDKISYEILTEYLSAFRERTIYLSNAVPEIASRALYSELSYMLFMCDKIKDQDELQGLFNYMKNTLERNYSELINSPFLTSRDKILLEKMV
ncbi:glycosyltransferase family 2 protein [Paenibacillus vini]|uniref:Glycosyltransferase 2-like domain-containing protein n=1 Tax=Paenibacillus vini TaxID=1476024 RepID=A0ABQ4M853_9BACL|nr:glycosyltransferase family 2 protein [Paenibacillus vini]GIP51625.1 hypothetical protein J42TS3_06600 [Paenibacillus vini]